MSARAITPTKPEGEGTAQSPYEIGTADELYWFAGLVNGTLEGERQNTAAWAELTKDITLNENVLDEDGNLNGDGSDFEQWTPISKDSDSSYKGTFDGQNYAISGLYINDDDASVGLFAFIGSGAEVKNVGIEDSYINFSGGYAGGGVCGFNNEGVVANCYFLSGTASSGVGLNSGTAADVEEKSQSQFSSGEVTHLLQNGQEDEVWGQEIGTDELPRLSYNEDDKVCKVTFMNGGDEVKTVYINMGKTIEEPDIDVGKGFYVDGWYADPDFERPLTGITLDGNIRVYAKWTTVPEEEPDSPAPPPVSYTDVAEDDWFAPAVSFVSERNLMSGMGGGLFSPYLPFTKPFML